MFTYLISPSNGNNTHFLIAFNIVDDTITGFVKHVPLWAHIIGKIPIIGEFFSYSHIARFGYCFSEYAETNNATFVRGWEQDHSAMHSSDTDEKRVIHQHIKHNKTITLEILRDFLSQLGKCELIQNIVKDDSIFNAQITEDIMKEFQQYLSQPNKRMIVGNNPHYKKLLPSQIPTIAEHERCLTTPQSLGCTGDNPLSPDRLRLPTISAVKEPINDGFSSIQGIALATCALFALRKWMARPHVAQQNHVSPSPHHQ